MRLTNSGVLGCCKGVNPSTILEVLKRCVGVQLEVRKFVL